jgi:hypothetical protein
MLCQDGITKSDVSLIRVSQLVRVSNLRVLRVVSITFTSTLEDKDECLGLWSQKEKDAQLEKDEI